MASRRFITTFMRARDFAPLDRQLARIIGSISGVSPIATVRANRKASKTLPVRQALKPNVSVVMISIMRIIIQTKSRVPSSKAVASLRSTMRALIAPNCVSRPVASTSACPVPLWTLLPMRQPLGHSWAECEVSIVGSGMRSTGMDSPVRADWERKKSLAWIMRQSAGMMEPAASTTTSPGTISSIGTLVSTPSRRTRQEDFTIAWSLAMAWAERLSWK